MSNAVLKGNASGTGTVTLESPNTNTDRTISFPDATCKMAYEDSSENLQVNSGYGSKATAYGCRAWVNYSGTANTIRASGNVSSVTDRADGRFTVNLTNAMPDANYSTSISASNDTSGTSGMVCHIDLPFAYPTASAIPIIIGYVGASGMVSGATNRDTQYVNIAIFR